MYFSDGAGNTATDSAFDFVFTDTSHPVTSIFLGGVPLRMFNTGQIGIMTQPWAADVTWLAENADNSAQRTLGVAEAGASNFITPAGGEIPGSIPAPARRSCLGFHENSMSDPTLQGAILFQRLAQWMVGDPVNAGDTLQPTAVVTRAIAGQYTPGSGVDVTLSAVAIDAGAVSVTETLPTGWTVQNANATLGTATATGNQVTWDFTFSNPAEEATLTYTAMSPASACGPEAVSGTYDAGPGGTQNVLGDSAGARPGLGRLGERAD